MGIVFLDFDPNFCQGAIQVAQVILSNIENVQLISGCLDDKGNVGTNIIMSGTTIRMKKKYSKPV